MESLKAQLDKKNHDLEELQRTNFDLKSQLRSNRSDHRDSLNDMETDQGRFLSQVDAACNGQLVTRVFRFFFAWQHHRRSPGGQPRKTVSGGNRR